MAYSWYYNHFQGLTVPFGSRSRAYVFPGAVCPDSCSFGRVHGTAPARGSMSFKDVVMVPVGQVFWIQIGQSIFYGRAVSGKVENKLSSGNGTDIQLVDMRDRLHDVNHFSQYNMMDDDGTWWHIYAEEWLEQTARYILDLQDIEDFRKDQEIQDIESVKDGPPLFTAMTLLNYFSHTYNFTYSFSESAEQKLRTGYPDNLDFNGGRRVIDCVDEILSKLNLQFTCWGDLHLHVTERGVAENTWERQLLAGNFDPCSLNGHVESALGGELNDQGRRIKITGGRNKHEWIHPCKPDWNPKWTLEMVNDVGFQISALLIKLSLTMFHKLEEFPVEWRDERKYNGRPRNELTLKDYIESIPYKAYVIDFSVNLIEVTALNGQFLQNKVGEENWLAIGDYVQATLNDNNSFTYVKFDYTNWLFPFEPKDTEDSFLPISANLPSDVTRQFTVKATSRKFDMKGLRDEQLFAQGKHTWITDGVNLDIDDKVLVTDPPGELHDRQRYWRVVVMFSEIRVGGFATKIPGAFGQPEKVDFTWLSDRVYVRIAQDREQFQMTFGEQLGAPRVREISRNVQKLSRSFIFDEEVPILVASLAEGGFTNYLYAEDIAQEIATRALSHQMVTVAGHMQFRTNAGFMPSGIIDNVSVNFNSRTGTQEQVNFTNIRSDERVPVFHAPLRRKVIKGEEELIKDKLREEGKRILKHYNQQGQGVPIVKRVEGQLDRLDRSQIFGGERNAAAVEVATNEFPADGQLYDGEIFVVDQATG